MARLKYLLDTHVFLWASTDKDRLGAKAARAIISTLYEQLAISDVTLHEVDQLLHENRISFKGPPASFLGNLLNYVTLLPIT
jgi:PIN domain nuclease of toxin-antitoxin system